MKLPNCDKAYIPEAKLYDYLLSPIHPSGMTKAKFFLEFGFDESNAEFLEAGLLGIARTGNVVEKKSTEFGPKYVVDGVLPTFVNTLINIRTVWIIEVGKEKPRFVTAHPLSKWE